MTEFKLTQNVAQEPNESRYAHALVFTGHMIDRPDRAEPRFPAWAEGRARAGIRDAILRLQWAGPGESLGIAGAANGGDLLFHEVCGELGIATRVLLALPVAEFVARSVAPAGARWVERFYALLAARAGDVSVMGDGDGLLEGKTVSAWQRANLWMLEEAMAVASERMLLALWDGGAAGGPGGTEHRANAARRVGVGVAAVIDLRRVVGS
jgi:hypothetical protein